MLDLFAAEVVHGTHVANNEFLLCACGLKLTRDAPAIQVTSQYENVTCESCARTLRAAGIACRGPPAS